MQAKHKEEIFALQEMIEKSLLLKEFLSAIPPPSPVAIPKAHPGADFLPKTTTERWNQSDLNYFNPHLDQAHGEGEIILVEKDIYYRNVVLFVQRLQSPITFQGATLVKANIITSLQGSALEWYTFELSNFDWNALNNNPSVKSWVNTFSHCFKVPTSMALGLFTHEIYSINNVRARQPLAQYVCAIMRHGTGCKIVNVVNQLSFAYQGIILELQVLVSPPTYLTNAANFIYMLEEKQEV